MLGSAYTALSSNTNRMRTYFQRAYTSIGRPRGDLRGRRTQLSGKNGSGGLQRALREHVGDGGALDAQRDAAGDFDGDEVVAHVGHRAGDAAAGDHFVAALQLVEHRAM